VTAAILLKKFGVVLHIRGKKDNLTINEIGKAAKDRCRWMETVKVSCIPLGNDEE